MTTEDKLREIESLAKSAALKVVYAYEPSCYQKGDWAVSYNGKWRMLEHAAKENADEVVREISIAIRCRNEILKLIDLVRRQRRVIMMKDQLIESCVEGLYRGVSGPAVADDLDVALVITVENVGGE